MGKDLNQNTAEQTTGFCGGCRSNCPLSAPNCPTGMERAGWSSEEMRRRWLSGQCPSNAISDPPFEILSALILSLLQSLCGKG